LISLGSGDEHPLQTKGSVTATDDMVNFGTTMRIVAASTATAALLIGSAAPVTSFFLHKSFALSNGRTVNSARDKNNCCRRASVICQLTADDILAQARAKTGINNDEQQNELTPKLFEDDLLVDMQQVLLKLEKRVKEGPGSLSLLEVDTLGRELNRIAVEMRVNQDKKPPRPQRSAVEPEPSRASFAAAGPVATPSPASEAAQQQPSPSASSFSIPAALSGLSASGHNPEEGAAFDGHGGMGQPRGTVNTYVIPGMDEMSPEEYRAALQKSVSDRQAIRRRSTTVGNASSRNYLDNLSRKPEEVDD